MSSYKGISSEIMMLYYLLLHICIAFRYLGQNPYLSYQCLLNIISLENMLKRFAAQ